MAAMVWPNNNTHTDTHLHQHKHWHNKRTAALHLKSGRVLLLLPRVIISHTRANMPNLVTASGCLSFLLPPAHKTFADTSMETQQSSLLTFQQQQQHAKVARLVDLPRRSLRSIFMPSFFFPHFPHPPSHSSKQPWLPAATAAVSVRVRGWAARRRDDPRLGGRARLVREGGMEGWRGGGEGLAYAYLHFNIFLLYRAWTRKSWRRFGRRLICLTAMGKGPLMCESSRPPFGHWASR